MTEDELFTAVHEYERSHQVSRPASVRIGQEAEDAARAKLMEAIRAWAYAPQHIDKIATPEGWVSVLELCAEAAVGRAYIAWCEMPPGDSPELFFGVAQSYCQRIVDAYAHLRELKNKTNDSGSSDR